MSYFFLTLVPDPPLEVRPEDPLRTPDEPVLLTLETPLEPRLVPPRFML